MAARKKPKPTAELFKDMPIEEYHEHTRRLSKSMLQKFNDCPERFDYLYNKGGQEKSTPSLRLGNLVHLLALQPELYKQSYHVLPETYIDGKGAEKPWRNDPRMQVYKDEVEKAGDLMMITKADKLKAEAMAKSIANNAEAKELLEGDGYIEASIFFKHDGIPFRCRPDDMKNNGLLNDLKITRSNKPGLFRKDAWNFGYHLSVAITAIGYEELYKTKPDNYTFICVEQEPPYIVQCYDTFRPFDPISGLSLYDMGMYELEKLIKRYKECKEQDHWPAYFEGIEPLGAPAWAVKQMMEGK